MSFFPKLHSAFRLCPSMSLASPRLHSRRYPPRLCLDHSHCPVLVPATLAAFPSTRRLPSATCSMSLSPNAPLKLARFPLSLVATSRLYLLCRFAQKLHSLSRDVFYVADPVRLHSQICFCASVIFLTIGRRSACPTIQCCEPCIISGL